MGRLHLAQERVDVGQLVDGLGEGGDHGWLGQVGPDLPEQVEDQAPHRVVGLGVTLGGVEQRGPHAIEEPEPARGAGGLDGHQPAGHQLLHHAGARGSRRHQRGDEPRREPGDQAGGPDRGDAGGIGELGDRTLDGGGHRGIGARRAGRRSRRA